MKKLAILMLLAVELALSSCSTQPPDPFLTTTTSGTWEAVLTGGVGEASKLSFTTAFTVTDINGENNELDITAFSFINNGACFTTGIDGSTELGIAALSATNTGQVTGTMTYTVTSTIPAGNVLTLTTGQTGGVSGTTNGTDGTIGTLSDGVVWGTWSLTGGQGDSSCTGQGQFVMCQGKATCSIP